ncbi:transporter substrate-binding domain-containing protein [Cytobacillus solani]|uniref:Amino acid ABC transporter substrate-binding protein n=1 Tax=Cytobacillus solani TaxID=1637975 RepID=A0A0Q3VJS9_9BACI|nr:amino acid ABC transporter substrate-binding protein [Cytobacillus solani]KQL21135.1 amino acid ABC transporter substrate-binding protein [Cytobacillus solani]USK54437.1 amino acid ABC transporter substrate-binding protein [Cytobacillus solani]
MRKFSLLALLFSFVLVISACGTNKANPESEGNNAEKQETQTEDLMAKVKDEGKLVVGTEGTYPPFTFHDDKGELTGFDVEIVKEVAKRLGVEPVFMETQWDAMFAGLDSKRFDLVANQVGIRPDRQEKYDFSDPYITSAGVLIKHVDNEAVTSFENIEGLKAAQSMTSNYADIAKSHGAEIVGVEGFNQAIELINSKRADVTINDNLSFLDFKKHKPDAPVEIAATLDDASQSGLMFRKGSETLINEVNKALKEMIEDGTYLEISEKWFGEDVLK